MARQQLEDQALPHLCAYKLGGTTGEQDRLCNPGLQHRKRKFQNLWLEKPCGGYSNRRNSQPHRRIRESHRVQEYTQTHPPGNQHQKGPICLWVACLCLKASLETSKQHCSLSDPSPTYSTTTQQNELPWQKPKAPPLTW